MSERLLRKFPQWPWFEHLARYLFSAEYVKDKIVVDCACGIGLGSKIFIENGARNVYGFDKNEGAIKKAKKNCENLSNISFDVSNALEIPLPDNICDVYVSLETIEHIREDNIFLKEARRIIKNGGIFVCSTPNRLISNPNAKPKDKPGNRFHVREYSQDEFRELLKPYFDKVELFGLSEHTPAKIKWISFFKYVFFFSHYIWAIMIKFPKIFWDDLDKYKIEKIQGGEYEYIIAVCYK